VPSRTVGLRVQGVIFVGVFFNEEAYWTARLFWQHTGFGISSRLADHILSLIDKADDFETISLSSIGKLIPVSSQSLNGDGDATKLDFDPKAAIRLRISELISNVDFKPCVAVDPVDIFLFPTGMNALWNVHELCIRLFSKNLPTVCFG
jgi:hypothetical protein